jgi:hypothetical protein
MNSTFRRLLLVAAVLVILFLAGFFLLRKPIYRFADWSGPQQSSVVSPVVAATPSLYAQGGENALAIYLTDAHSDWLGLAHGLKTIGVPFIVTDRYEEALKHHVVLAYPTISGRVLSKEALQALAAFPRNGGTLIGFEILGGGLNEVFGFGDMTASRGHKTLTLTSAFAGHLDEKEAVIPLAGPSGAMPAEQFSVTTGTPVARYDDGSTAIVQRDFGRGRTFAIGFDIGAYLAKAYNGRHDYGRSYINAYESSVDSILRLMRQLYRSSEPLAVTLWTVPQGKSASVIITHDIDYTRSIVNAIRYAEFEKQEGVAATYFVQTKYVRDWNDDIFFNEQGASLTHRLAGMGMEVASHSVSHSRSFAAFPLGTGKEAYPDYVPFVKSQNDTRDGSILGELRVSRFLLEKAVPDAKVQSFRPGHLAYPFALPQAMQASGYRFSSSISSGTAMTHLPFQLNVDRGNEAETAIFEFPITIEDELQRPMTGRVDAAIDILRHLQVYGGLCTVLIHPDVFDDKFAFLQQFVARAKGMDVWFGTLAQFGNWWRARNGVTLDARRGLDGYSLVLNTPQAIQGLAVEVPTGWKLQATENAMQKGNIVYLDLQAGTRYLRFR